jgi:hypothetical protein
MKEFRRFMGLAALAATVCALATPAMAQINPSHLTGTVKDAQGAVLPGVNVTASSPALLGAQTVTTEANGEYRFPSLPSGTYTLTFDLAGFQTMKREGIVLAVGQTLAIDATLQVATLQESVTVTGESPVIDTRSTAVGYVQTTQQLIGVPTSSDLWGALAQTPGVRMGGVDVGGSHKSQQSGYEAYGINGQTRVMNDGVDTTEGTGGAGFYQDYYAQNEIVVSAAGQDVSMNTPGAAVIAMIKSGGNKFSGLENIVYEGSSFVANNIDSATQARGFTGQPNLVFWEGHAELGGPIVKDKLWFYGAYNHFKINKAISGIQQSVATDLGLFNNFTTKESYRPSSKDTLIGYYQWGKKQKPLRGLSTTTPKESALAQTSPSWAYNGRWQRTWSNRVFSEINIGDFGYNFPEQPNVPFATNPPRHDTGTGVDSGAGWFNAAGSTGPFILARNKPQVFGNLTYFLPTGVGSHDFKFGGEWLNDKSQLNSNGTSGPILYLDLNSAVNQVRVTDFGDPGTFGSGWTQSSNFNRRYALYGQDRWTISNRVTLTYGVRYDYQRPYYDAAKRVPVLTYVFQPTTTPGASLFTKNTVAPRLGVSYSPDEAGKSVIKGFYGRFYFNYADTVSGANPGGANYQDRVFNDLNGNRILDGPQELGPVVASFGGTSTTIDPNLKTPHTDEIDFSYDRQFWGESAFRVAYVRKMIRNLYSIINAPLINQFTVPFTTTINLQQFGTSGTVTTGQTTLNLMDIPSNLKGVSQNVYMNIPDSLGGSSYTYDTLGAAFNKRFGKGLFLNAAYDYQWRKDVRSAGGGGATSVSNSPLSSDPIGTIGTGSNGVFFPVNPAVPLLQSTNTWTAHISARYNWKYDIGTALNFSGQSGWPYSRYASIRLPDAGTRNVWLANLRDQRSDNIYIANVRLDKAFTVGGVKMTGMVDLFNVVNSNAVTNFNLANGARFNNINATVDPRTLEIGLRVEF